MKNGYVEELFKAQIQLKFKLYKVFELQRQILQKILLVNNFVS
jgi:hypothetical protein